MKSAISLALLAGLTFYLFFPSTALAQSADRCIQGYVWREAFPNDHVCVKPSTRSQAARDNRMAKRRIQRGGGAYGPDTCIQGYVWREAHPQDHVCVTPATREQTARDNRMANSRIMQPSMPPHSERPMTADIRQPMAQPAPPMTERHRPPPPTVSMIRCPVESVRAEIITPLPAPWWQTPQIGSVIDTSVRNIGGKQTLVCTYQAYGKGVSVMRELPPGVRNCQAIREGFRCR